MKHGPRKRAKPLNDKGIKQESGWEISGSLYFYKPHRKMLQELQGKGELGEHVLRLCTGALFHLRCLEDKPPPTTTTNLVTHHD